MELGPGSDSFEGYYVKMCFFLPLTRGMKNVNVMLTHIILFKVVYCILLKMFRIYQNKKPYPDDKDLQPCLKKLNFLFIFIRTLL